MRELLQIGEVAKLIGVSSKTIRYYHEIGLLAEPKRTEGGYRLYTAQDLLRLQRIRRLRSLGLPLDRIKEILGGSEVEQEVVLRNALQSLVEELTAQILELEERRVAVWQRSNTWVNNQRLNTTSKSNEGFRHVQCLPKLRRILC